MKENPELISELKEIIINHFITKGNEDVYLLSKQCGVGPSTIRRILSGKTRAEPLATTVLGIVSGVTGEKNIQKIVNSFGGEIGKKLKDCYQSIMDNTEFIPEYSNILSDRVAYIVYKLASSRRGTTNGALQKLMGIPAIDTVKELIDLGLIHYGDDGRIYSSNKPFALPEQVIKKHIPEMVRFSNFGSEFTNSSAFYSLSDSINIESYEEIREIIKKAVKEMKVVLKREESVGDVPFFFTAILDTMEVPSENNDITEDGK